MSTNSQSRRQFIRTTAAGLGALTLASGIPNILCQKERRKPNVLFIFADQWRGMDVGYMGHPDVKTPFLDRLAEESINFVNAVSCCPVCSPYRASLMTGQYPLTHGVFYNDKPLKNNAVSIARAFVGAGYTTGYIGKWHLDGRGRDAFIPRERRQGFQFWKARECTHDYNRSFYYADEPVRLFWQGYDAFAQTHEAQKYINEHARKGPFALFISWGPPHTPYDTAPEKYRDLFKDAEKIVLRLNIPESLQDKARTSIAGYYAHMAALDDCIGQVLKTLRDCEIEDNTILVFTSDHGDMLYSHGQTKKQKPWEESIHVPFLLRYPALLGKNARTIETPINTPDIMPTLLSLCDIDIPDTVEGKDYAPVIKGDAQAEDEAALIICPVPFHQWNYSRGGREYRGVRTKRYTFVRDIKGPWLLYDNNNDPYQLSNLCNEPDYAAIQTSLEIQLAEKLRMTRDEFLPGPEYMKIWGYQWDGNDAPAL